MSKVLHRGRRPPLRRWLLARAAITAALPLARLAPKRILRVLRVCRAGARPATMAEALAARQDVVDTSVRCAGKYCLQRSLATALLCRLRGTWPTWCAGVRTPPFTAHAWVDVAGEPVGEPVTTAAFHRMLTCPPAT